MRSNGRNIRRSAASKASCALPALAITRIYTTRDLPSPSLIVARSAHEGTEHFSIGIKARFTRRVVSYA